MSFATKCIGAAASLFLLAPVACEKVEDNKTPDAEVTADAAAPTANARGVDSATKTITIGALNDESGPAAVIGKPYAVGKRILVKAINAGETKILPAGWKVEMIERDHGYNPGRATQAYNEIKDKVMFISTSFGTPNTLPLQPKLAADKLMAYPASLSSKMAAHANTPPLGPSYELEAMRAMDWAVESAGGAEKVKAGIVYQQDDYGSDGLAGWEKAAKFHKVNIVSKQTIAPGQKDFAAVITGLKKAGATHILLTALPSATGPVLGTAAKMKYMPTWIGNTPAWIDRFFDPKVIPGAVFTNYHWVMGLPYWGEKVPGMDGFLAAYDKYGKDMSSPDFYILVSYIQGLVQFEAVKRAQEKGDMSPEGYAAAVKSISLWNAGGMIQPLDLTKFPYETGLETRVLKADMAAKSWKVVADYAVPKSYVASKKVAEKVAEK